jgi:hypothetical protein
VARLTRRPKVANLREDPVGRMAKHDQITPMHLDAARRWQALYDAAQMGSVKGMDPCGMKVDGGQFSEPDIDKHTAAIKRLHVLDVRLGDVGSVLVRRVLGDRMSIVQLAAIMGEHSALGLKRVGWRVRECLDTLVDVMGLGAEGKARRAPRDDHSRNAAHADHPALHAAVRRAQLRR